MVKDLIKRLGKLESTKNLGKLEAKKLVPSFKIAEITQEHKKRKHIHKPAQKVQRTKNGPI
jgi:hypothetical protein